MNFLRRILLGPGRLSDPLRRELEAEGLRFLDEGLVGSITYRNYRAPGSYANWRREATSGAVALTGRRLVVWTGRGKHIDVPLAPPLRDNVAVAVDETGRLTFGYDAGAFRPDRSGRVEVRLRTARAAEFLQLYQSPH